MESQTQAEKYTIFNDWCNKHGIIFPKLEYPAVFD